MPSIKDVAREAGVSASTVSNYLNERRMLPETAEKVRAAIAKLKYNQNYLARSLVKGHSHILGLIVSDIENQFFASMTRSFLDQALLMDMETVVMNTNFDPNRTLSCVRRLVSLQVPGVALLTSEIVPDISRELLAQKQIAAVYLGANQSGSWCSSILVDYRAGVGEAIAHLKNLAHTNIGFIAGPQALPSGQRRVEAFLECVQDLQADEESPVVESDGTFQGGYYACSKILATHRPTAILCFNDQTAMGAINCAHDRGIVIPRDMSIIGFDNTDLWRFTEPPLTSINIARTDIVRQALEGIRLLLESDDHEGQVFSVATKLIVRESTGKAPKKRQG